MERHRTECRRTAVWARTAAMEDTEVDIVDLGQQAEPTGWEATEWEGME